MRRVGRASFLIAALGVLALLMQAQQGPYAGLGQVMPAEAEQLFALANQDRAAAGLGRLKWDPALAEAARRHCLRMAAEGPIAHRYGGEPSLADRAAEAGAHFSLIEENVAVGPSADAVEQEWMHSPGHRANLLNASINRIGTAVVASHGTLYAVDDFTQAVPQLSQAQIEAQVAGLIRVSGVRIVSDPTQAREACASDGGMPPSRPGMQPRFVMRWQAANLNELPRVLADRLASGQYHGASVGSCTPQGENAFSGYRLAVLLY